MTKRLVRDRFELVGRRVAVALVTIALAAVALTAIAPGLVVICGCLPITPAEPPPAPPGPQELARLTLQEHVPSLLAADFNGDGIDDLVVCDPLAGEYPRSQSGDIYMLLGPVNAASLPDEGAELVLRGQRPYTQHARLRRGDLNGDGTPDLVVRATSGMDGMTRIRAIDGTLRGEHVIENIAMLTLAGPGTLGESIVVIDNNSDGNDDLVVSCPERSEVYIVHGPRAGQWTLPDDADATLSTPAGSLGWGMTAGDYDGDGTTELAVVEPVVGVVYILPTGLAGEQSADDVAMRIVRTSDPGNLLRGVDTMRRPGRRDALMVGTARSDSERAGGLFVLEDIPAEAVLERNAATIYTGAHLRLGVAFEGTMPGPGGEDLCAIGIPGQSHLPDSNLLGRVLLVPAGLTGAWSLDSPEFAARLAWQATGPQLQTNQVGVGVLFARTHRADRTDLVVAGQGQVLIFGWPD